MNQTGHVSISTAATAASTPADPPGEHGVVEVRCGSERAHCEQEPAAAGNRPDPAHRAGDRAGQPPVADREIAAERRHSPVVSPRWNTSGLAPSAPKSTASGISESARRSEHPRAGGAASARRRAVSEKAAHARFAVVVRAAGRAVWRRPLSAPVPGRASAVDAQQVGSVALGPGRSRAGRRRRARCRRRRSCSRVWSARAWRL